MSNMKEMEYTSLFVESTPTYTHATNYFLSRGNPFFIPLVMIPSLVEKRLTH